MIAYGKGNVVRTTKSWEDSGLPEWKDITFVRKKRVAQPCFAPQTKGVVDTCGCGRVPLTRSVPDADPGSIGEQLYAQPGNW